MKRTGGKNACLVCGHGQKDVIEALHVAGWSYDRLAARFDVSRNSLHRHVTNHLSDEKRTKLLCGTAELARLKELVAEDASSTVEVLGLMRGVLLNHFLRRAEADRTFELSRVAGTLLEVVKEVGRIRGEITTLNPALVYQDNRSTTNVAVIFEAPEFQAFTADLLQICLAHPEVRADVAALLRKHASGVEHTPAPLIASEARDAA